MEEFMLSMMVIILVVYICLLYLLFIKSRMRIKRELRFHNAILSVHNNAASLDDAYEQLLLNFNKICQELGNNNQLTLLDLLETFIHYYDAYSDTQFSKSFGVDKDIKIRDFIFSMCKLIKDNDPFIAVPSKEAGLLNNISDAIIKNNVDFGMAELMQLSTELVNREKLLKKKEKENQLTTVISIVSIVLTVFFGVLSFVVSI